MDKKKLAMLNFLIMGLLIGASVVAIVLLPTRYVIVSVSEPITITPDTISLSSVRGNTTHAIFTVVNSATYSISLLISYNITKSGVLVDTMSSSPKTWTAVSGTSYLDVTIVVYPNCTVGEYQIKLDISR